MRSNDKALDNRVVVSRKTTTVARIAAVTVTVVVVAIVAIR